jgi:hypothetical protein
VHQIRFAGRAHLPFVLTRRKQISAT